MVGLSQQRETDGGGRRVDGKVPEWVRGMSRLRCKPPPTATVEEEAEQVMAE